MDCQRARELVEKHMRFLTTLEGEKVAGKKEILDAFEHIKKCPDSGCIRCRHIVLYASERLSDKDTAGHTEQHLGWDGDY